MSRMAWYGCGMEDQWSDGVLEYWSVGTDGEFFEVTSLQHSSTLSFQRVFYLRSVVHRVDHSDDVIDRRFRQDAVAEMKI